MATTILKPNLEKLASRNLLIMAKVLAVKSFAGGQEVYHQCITSFEIMAALHRSITKSEEESVRLKVHCRVAGIF